MSNALSFLADPKYYSAMGDVATNALSTAWDRVKNGQAILTGEPIVNSLREQMQSSPDQMAMDWSNPVAGGLVGMIGKGAKASEIASILKHGDGNAMSVPKTQYELAHEVAQRNAALPVEQGGLGLHPDNTAMDRARAMGFDNTPYYHGTTHNFDKFGGKTHSEEGHLGAGHYLTSDPLDASANYAGEGPDLTGRLEREAENLLSMRDISWSGASDPAYQAALQEARSKLAGESQGHVLPLMMRSKKTVDISPNTKSWIDFSAKYDKEGEFVDDSKNAYKLLNTLQKQGDKYGFDAQQAMGDISNNAELYDQVRASDFDSALRKAESLMYAENQNTGSLAGNEVIRNIYKGLGYDAVKMDAKSAFPNMKNINDGTSHVIVNNPNQLRSRFAAFDPLQRNSSNLLAGGAAAAVGLGLYGSQDSNSLASLYRPL